jgi:hypothetical protein
VVDKPEVPKDIYTGGREVLQGLWPGVKYTKDDHEHWHANGGYYAHKHRGGDKPHEHESEGD